MSQRCAQDPRQLHVIATTRVTRARGTVFRCRAHGRRQTTTVVGVCERSRRNVTMNDNNYYYDNARPVGSTSFAEHAAMAIPLARWKLFKASIKKCIQIKLFFFLKMCIFTRNKKQTRNVNFFQIVLSTRFCALALNYM